MYRIIEDRSRKGYGYIRDYIGNLWFYGTLEQCKQFIADIERRETECK